MSKPRVRKVYLKLLSLLAIPFFLGGCAPKSDCKLGKNHVHKYVNRNNGVISYINSENLSYGDFDWQEEYIEINIDDQAFYEAKKSMFYGPDNWEYLYNVMSSKHDYLQFYYEYTTDDTITMVDADGNVSVFPSTTTHTGWSTNPNDSDNTGRMRICHNRFYGYNIVYNHETKKYEKVKSPLVDDIREIINDYPYFDKECSAVVSNEYKFDRKQLPSLKLSDFNDFTGPDLENKEMTANQK